MTPFFGPSTPPSPCSSGGETDPVNPSHYRLECGLQVIELTERMGFCLGNVVKYVLRAGKKGDALEDLKKARWYLDREITRLEREGSD